MYDAYEMKNLNEENLKMIGAKVPAEFAEDFKQYCRRHRFNQRELFYNLVKWWHDQEESIQWLIYRGKMEQALSQISKAAVDDENAAASASAK